MRETLLKPLRSAYLAINTLMALSISVVLAASSDGGSGARDMPVTKHYVGRSRAACETIDYRCPAGVEAFQDSEGCGCLMPAGGTEDEAPLAQQGEHPKTQPDATVK